jgi:hypothetical protein
MEQNQNLEITDTAIAPELGQGKVSVMVPKKVTNFKKVDEIVIPDIMFHPVKIGHPDLDRGFSELGGLIPSQVVIFTGMPGAGKTTLCAEILSRLSVAYEDRDAIFISLEMSDFQLKLVARKTSGFNNVVIESTIKWDDYEALIEELTILRPSVVVLDSIQAFAGEGNRKQIACVNAFTEFAKSEFIPVILIGHADKGGHYKGPSTLLHQVDTHLKVGIDKDTGERLITFGKNRFGGFLNPIPFKIKSDAVLIGSDVFKALGTLVEDDDATKEAFAKFHNENMDSHKLDWEKCKEVSQIFLSYVKREYADKYDYMVGDLEKVTMNFQAKRHACYCRPQTGELFMAKHAASVLESGTIKYGYKMERPIQEQYIFTKEDEWMWILCHEFCHLITGMQKHNKVFFKQVEKMVQENMFMFSSSIEK